jgi:hypothetical protein
MSTAAAPEVTTIEHLDFPTPCQHSQHELLHVPDDPAKYIVEFHHECGLTRRYALCHSGWVPMKFTACPPHLGGCGAKHLPRVEVFTIIETLP